MGAGFLAACRAVRGLRGGSTRTDSDVPTVPVSSSVRTFLNETGTSRGRMVSDATLVVVIASVGGTVATVLTIASLWIWRHTTNLHDEDIEKVAALLDAEWERAGATMADFFVDVVAEMDREVGCGSRELRAEVERIVVEELDEADVNQLVGALQDIGRGRSLHRSHRDGYEDAYAYFAVASIMTVTDVLVGIAHVVALVPGANSELVIAVLGFGGAVTVLRGLLSFRTGRQRKEEFVDAWEGVRLED